MTFPFLWFLFLVMVCNCARQRKETLLSLMIGDDLSLLVVPVPSHGLQLCHKDRHSHPKNVSVQSRDYSLHNLNNFKIELALKEWEPVYNSLEVNAAYSEFWKIYINCHDACFPLVRKRYNKNIHTKNPFMTLGLLVSRYTKTNFTKFQSPIQHLRT
jgi:hypothetical protein